MANDKDRLFEKLYFLWKGEGEKRNQGNGLHMTRKGMSFEEFITFAQNLKALC